MTAATKTKQGIGIVRVSSKGQRDRYGPAAQRQEILDACASMNTELADIWEYQESATSFDKRPEFNAFIERLVAMGKAGEVDTVIFGRPDRLGRDGEDSFFYYLTVLERTGGLQVRFARDDVNPDNPHRNFLLFLHAFKAKTDAETIKRNTIGGRRRRAESGKLPTGHVPWPFDYDSRQMIGARATGQPRLNSERAAWVRLWADWILSEKIPLRAVCRRMQDAGVLSPLGRFQWAPSSVRRILANRAMLGEFYAFQQDESPMLVLKDDALAILSVEEYERVQSVLKANKALSPGHTKYDYTPLQGFVYCHCGRKTAGNTKRSKVSDRHWSYFRCGVHRNMTANAEELWGQARDVFAAIVTHPMQVIPALNEHLRSQESRDDLEDRKRFIQGELKELDRAFERVVRLFAILDGYGEDKLKAEVERLRSRRASLEADLESVGEALQTNSQTKLTEERVREVCGQLAKVLDRADEGEWKSLLRDFGFKITLQPDGEHIMRVSVNVVPSASNPVAPTLNAGRPGEISTSTSTINPSSPTTAQVLDLASICSRAEEPIGDATVRRIATTVKRPEQAVAGCSAPVSRLVRREDGSTTKVALLGETL